MFLFRFLRMTLIKSTSNFGLSFTVDEPQVLWLLFIFVRRQLSTVLEV